MPRINLLPWRADLRAKRKKEFLIAIAGAVVFGGLLGFGGKLTVQSWTSAQNNRNDILRAKITELDRQIEEINALDAQKSRLIARMEIIDRLQRARPEAVHMVDELVNTLPEGVYLTEVAQSNQRIEIKGSAQSSTRVSALMRNVDSSSWLSRPQLEVVQTIANGPSRDAKFTIFAQQIGMADEETEERLQ
jgi:type IV pilus assembly protein PilN